MSIMAAVVCSDQSAHHGEQAAWFHCALFSRRCAAAKGLSIEIARKNIFGIANKTLHGKYESAQRCPTHSGLDTACCDPAWGATGRTVRAVASGLGFVNEDGRNRTRT